jgi:DUF4097 and DUF4098 domain-containing protein YvlB
MEEEIKKILNMLEQNKISANEATELIDAIKGKSDEKDRKIESNWINSITDNVLSSIKETFDGVGDYVNSSIKAKGKVIVDAEYDCSDLQKLNIKSFGGDLTIRNSDDIKLRFDSAENINGLVKKQNDEMNIKLFGSDAALYIPKNIEILDILQLGGDLNCDLIANKVKVNSKGGDVELKLNEIKELVVKSVGGDVACYFPENIDGKFNVKCEGGDFSSDISYEGEKRRGEYSGKFKQGKELDIEIHSLGGDVKFKKL